LFEERERVPLKQQGESMLSADFGIDARHGNDDRLTGAPGAHPVGVGLGAGAGAAAGAAVGSLVGLVGTVVGATVGALAGGLAGKGVAEGINPTGEDEYWPSEPSCWP
jgi:phage tail tape-measure protein